MSLCEIVGLLKNFGGVTAVADVSFAVEAGSILAVIGPNGAGKTTLINMVTGVLQPDKGSVRFEGKDITGVPLHRLAQVGLTRTFQHPRVFRNMTVLDNIMVAARSRRGSGMLASGVKWPTARHDERRALAVAQQALAAVGLACDPAMPSDLLTTGQDKLLELARLLATGPKLVFLDEPAAGLDDHETAELSDRVARVSQSGVTVVLVEHNMQMVMSLADRIVVIDAGQKIAEGTPAEVRANPAVIEAYLGKDGELMDTFRG